MTTSQLISNENLVYLIEQAQTQIGPLSRAQKWLQELTALRNRLVKREHTIAVFGAFSAGKSSLLNAILAKQALAVSPNPTTATVTHLYFDQAVEEGTATVYAKSREQMWDDIFQAFSSIHLTPRDFEEAIFMAKSLKMADFSPHTRKSVAFLRAASAGYNEMGYRLGTEFVIPASKIRTFTAEEQYACYVQRVDIVQNTDLLQSGFVLVDTPGVDSIHKRHTDVAFEYMRKADAIIFVLYYTHAFSRADKEFLLQLSGVQDVAGTDKLFVVINAVDLAKSQEERAAVRERVRAELVQVGIRKPRVYEISSQIGFAAGELESTPGNPQFEKLVRLRLHLSETDSVPDPTALYAISGVPAFIADLQTFICEQSENLMRESANRTLRVIGQQISDECDRFNLIMCQDQHRMLEMRQHYLGLAHEWQKLGNEFAAGSSVEETGLRNDWQELVFHAGERVRFRYSALFREAFNPGQFRAGSDVKRQLNEAATDFAVSLERLIEIEVRTFSLRIEQSVLGLLEHIRDEMKKMCTKWGVPMVHYELEKPEEVQMDGSIRAHIPLDPISQGFKYFSSPKQFFEGDGVSLMMNSIENGILEMVKQELLRLTDMVSEPALNRARFAIHKELSAAADVALSNEFLGESNDVQSVLANWIQARSWFFAHDWMEETV